MTYDKDELDRLGITEEMIQRHRDRLLKGLTDYPPAEKSGAFFIVMRKVLLPFVIDMLDANTFQCEPCDCGLHVTIIINL